jgi:hypothetical protein
MQNDIMQQIIEQPRDELRAIVRQLVGEDAMPVGALTAKKIGRSVGHATMGIFRVEGRAQLQGQELPWSAVVKALGTPVQHRNAVGDNLQYD